MKKFSLIILAFIAVLSACKKETAAVCNYQPNNIYAPVAEKDSLQRYLIANGVFNATRDTTGVYYIINAAGTGTVTPVLCSYLSTNYSGNLLSNGSSFTGGTIAGSFALGDLIPAWQKVLPLIKAGGTITMYVPPTLAYGSTPRYNSAGVVVIPANSYLKFTVQILEIK